MAYDEQTFPDDEGRRAWCLDRAIGLMAGRSGFLGKEEEVEPKQVIETARSFLAFIQGEDDG